MSTSNIDKNKNYKVNENNQQQTNQLLKPDSEQIELEHLSNKEQEQKNDSNKTNNASINWRYRLENILDFNLKFESPLLERFYKKSYLPVTRLLFSQYLFYLIAVFVSWIIYFLTFTHSNAQINGSLYSYDDNETLKTGLHIDKEKLTFYNPNIFIAYSTFSCLILASAFLYLILSEFKESRYRYLEKLLKENESSTKVDCKAAERDLKKAMQEVVKKEKENLGLSDLLAAKYKRVSRSRDLYAKLANPIALCTVALMFGFCFVGFVTGLDELSHFIMFAQCLILFYVIYPFQMAIPVFFGLMFSILFEFFTLNKHSSSSSIWIKLLLHLSLHLIGLYLKLSVQAVKRDTFLKVAHMYRAHMTSQYDKAITEQMIKSIMPPLFTHVFGKPEDFKQSVNCVHLMRPLFIYPVSELSILFADIVGFTRMSSTKTAEELVFLLNDLYGRFDRICEKTNCEKISTLGDCYYCVSGCLNGRQDHAKCCVEMGLLMIREIELFNKMHMVDVNMRVGVHTGNALCGFIGGKRFRFDVWSSDVTLANKMESTGRPGCVHISQVTYEHLKEVACFNLETAEPYSGKPTYFVMRQTKKETVADALNQQKAASTMNLDQNATSEQQQQETHDQSTIINENEIVGVAAPVAVATTTVNQLNNDFETDNDYDENLLISALKNAQFFQPDVNWLTMRFNSVEEKKYQSYVMGVGKQFQTTQTTSGHVQNKTEFMEKNSSFLWKRPQNSFFIAIFIAFSVNLFVSTSYLIAAASPGGGHLQSSCLYRMSKYFSHDVSLILSIFFAFIIVQALFLIFYFIQCCQLNNSSSQKQKKTFLFDQPHINGELITEHVGGGARSSFTVSTLGNNKIMANPGTGARIRLRERFVLKRYILIHFVSILFICMTPILIISSMYPVLNNILNSSLIPFTHVLSEQELAKIKDHCPNETMAYYRRDLNAFSTYSYLAFSVALINFCSFVQLSSLFKTISALIFALIYGIPSFIGMFNYFTHQLIENGLRLVLENDFENLLKNQTNLIYKNALVISFNLNTSLFLQGFLKENALIVLDLILLVILIWLANRQSELIQRLGFKCDQNANMKVTYATEQKELANWLIEVVLPNHVVSHVQAKKQYSRNYDCVGVLFVSLCNFGEFFEETYEGGRELLRVLNEITVDFDRLFDEPKYTNVEKIKSIGSTFMIASGLCTHGSPSLSSLNETKQPQNINHLYDLIDFALELSEKLDSFNNEAMSVCHFKFKMRMGFHCGPVTAGVIGTERLLYDIWGDTVNVASRMDSTGQAGLLQTTEEAVNLLKSSYKFDLRGSVNIKGKDNMTTFTMDPRINKKMNSII